MADASKLGISEETLATSRVIGGVSLVVGGGAVGAAVAGIPTSQQPISQRSIKTPDGRPAGRQYDYEVRGPGGGTQQYSVQHSLTDNVPGHGPHFEAGQVKAGGQLDSLGRPRIRNPKIKVNE